MDHAFFQYSGTLSSIEKVPSEKAPKYKAIDDGKVAKIDELPVAHGWLLEFRVLKTMKKMRWAVFAIDGTIYVDTGQGVFNLSCGDIHVDVRRFLGFVRVSLVIHRELRTVFWIYTPIHRYLFADPQCPDAQCEPLFFIFRELSDSKGQEEWSTRWAKGLSHLSTALTPIDA